mgnify:CR=1 FL=1
MPTPAELIQQARRLHAEGRIPSAIQMYQAALKSQPRNADAHQWLGLAYFQIGQHREAVDHATRAAKLEPMSAERWFVLADLYRHIGLWNEARQTFEKATWLDKNHTGAVAGLAQIMGAMGEREQALALVAPAAARDDAHPEAVAVHADLCLQLGKPEEGLERLRRHAERNDLPAGARQRLLFQLGHVYQAMDRYDEAFETFASANKLHTRRWDRAGFRASVDRAIADWSPEAYANVAPCPIPSDRPVFIVGMPRSGTTLVEQIIASHPRCYGAGELGVTRHVMARLHNTRSASVLPIPPPSRIGPDDVVQAAAFYIRALKSIEATADRVTDKLPLNFLYLPLLARMFPSGHFIHCLRDPVDTCLSCWTHHFAGPMHFAYDFDDLAAFYADYLRLMRHWTETLGVPALEVRYERLVAEQEPQIRRIVESLRIEWNDACLRFHENPRLAMTVSMEQVRRPMYATAVARHERYGERLDPLRQALRREGVDIG